MTKRTFTNVWSQQLRNRRDIDVYLPPSYSVGWALVFSLTFAALGGALAIYLALT